MKRFCWRTFIMLLLLITAFRATPLAAQISPGRLAEPHAQLEGSQNCLSCHRSRRGVDPQRCLMCHTGLGDRIRANQGLHALPEYTACEKCHIDHQGRSFELIWWGEGGRDTFDHTSTGWPLQESHARAECSDCHNQGLLWNHEALRLDKGSFSTERTFQGLSTQCSSCHADPHFGQFGQRLCSDCHSQAEFADIAFDHDNASFSLTGQHAELECSSCHKSTTNPPRPTSPSQIQRALLGMDALLDQGHHTRFAEVPHTECGSCHRDPHESRLGASCSKCHNTNAWSSITTASFDHSLTAYPLAGKHRSLTCASCHSADFSRARPQSAACTNCHQDVHLGQLTDQQGIRPCETCHSVDGFTPATFGSAAHQATNFPLSGAHLDTGCESCHKKLPTNELAILLSRPEAPVADQQNRPLPHFRVPHESCQACHQDPHRATFVPATGQGCIACHDTEAWWSISFHHRSTGFPLQAGHAGLDCTACHTSSTETTRLGTVDFSQTTSACSGCHADPHGGQFTEHNRAGQVVTCERCHNASAFAPTRFDHQNDSRFPLEGAHLKVACTDCHPAGPSDATHSIVYRPLARDCASCHADAQKEPYP